MEIAQDEQNQTVFVMMPFRPDFDDVYATVKDAISAVDQTVEVKTAVTCRSTSKTSEQ